MTASHSPQALLSPAARKSEYVLFVQNIDERTRRSDVEYEFERAGKVRYASRIRGGGLLIEMAKRDDAKWAYKNIGKRPCLHRWPVHSLCLSLLMPFDASIRMKNCVVVGLWPEETHPRLNHAPASVLFIR